MRTRARGLIAPLAAALSGALLLAWQGLLTPAFTDYEDEVEPALKPLIHGDLAEAVGHLPAYAGSLVLRSPFAFLPQLWGGGDLALYRSMAAPCLLAAVILGVFLYSRGEQLGRSRAARWVALALCAFNPLTLRALEIGHPEELLGGVLCVGAALAAASRRPMVAGLLLGLAIVNKPWAMLAVVPVVALAPEGRVKLLALAGGICVAVFGPLALVSSSAVDNTGKAVSDAGVIFQPWQVWWFLGDHGHVVMGTYGAKAGFRAAPDWMAAVGRPVVVLVPTLVALALAPRLRGRAWHDGLLLLALVLLLRCMLDPWNVIYYELPFLLALVAWELHARDGVPVTSLVATLLSWVTLEQLTRQVTPDVQAVAYLAWAVPFACAMGLRLASPERWRALLRPLREAPLLAQLVEVGAQGQRGGRA
jgi:hypothetical protein